jgi:D-alanine transaminase
MSEALPVVHLDGKLLPLTEARIPVLDRGFLYGDAVYEVIASYHGTPFLQAAHLARLDRSLTAIHCPNPLQAQAWAELISALLAANPPAPPEHEGRLAVYLQVTRGDTAGRAHTFAQDAQPRVFAMALANPPPAPDSHRRGVAALTLDDQRWRRCHIKSTSLLANVLARQEAASRDVAEAILHRQGQVTEGSSSNVLIWHEGALATPPDGPDILPGVTRDWVLAQARDAGIPCHRRPVTLAEMRAADEVWLTSTTREILPVSQIDDRPIGAGCPGPAWKAAIERFRAALPTG